MLVDLFPEATAELAPGAPPRRAPPAHSVLRAYYNAGGVDDAAAHVKHLHLVPRVRQRRGDAQPPEGFDAALRLRSGGIAVPRFYGLAAFGAPKVLQTVRGAPLAAGLRFRGTLRDYQAQAVQAVRRVQARVGGCLLEAACGAGKTTMAIAIAVAAGVRTVILVHTSALLQQWCERIAHFCPSARVGRVVQDRHEIDGCDFVVAMMQTVVARRELDFATVGHVVVDEAHHVSTRSFTAALRAFRAHTVLGLTATPERRDGLGWFLAYALGPCAARIRRPPADQVEVHVHWGAAAIEPVMDRRGELSYAATVTKLLADAPRNDRIVAAIRRGIADGYQVLVLSERRRHLERLCEKLSDANPALFVGETSKKKRAARDEAAATANPLLASYQMATEGLDIPRLGFVVLASPRGAPAVIEQAVGRVMRPHPCKDATHVPQVVDFRDGVFQGMLGERLRTYRRLGFRVIEE